MPKAPRRFDFSSLKSRGEGVPEREWLAELVLPFSDPSIAVVAGQTTYGRGAFAEAMTAVDFLYFESPLGPEFTRNFYANNVAFRRGVLERHPFPSAANLRHGQCTLLAFALHAEGTRIVLARRARTIHRLTPSKREWIGLRFARGADAHEIAPRLLGAVLGDPRKEIRLGSLGTAMVLGGRLVHSLRAIEADHDRSFSRPGRRHLRRAAIVGISMMDLAGALTHSARGSSVSKQTRESRTLLRG